MASTTSKGFPYPLSTDSVDVPSDIYNLAITIDNQITTTAAINTIPYRETGGTLTIGTPTLSTHAATKGYADAQIALAVPFTTKGDIIYAGSNGSAVSTATTLSIGGSGSILSVASGIPSWLGIGTNGYVLTVSGGAPTWASPTFTPGTGTGTGFSQTSGTLTANTATTIDTVAVSSFIGIEYLLQMKQGTKVRASTIRVITDGSTIVSSSEYGIVEIGASMTGVNVLASYSASNAILQVTVTDATTTNVTWRLSKIAQ
jgi:hypothetical protein